MTLTVNNVTNNNLNLGVVHVGPLAFMLHDLGQITESLTDARQKTLQSQKKAYELAAKAAQASYDATIDEKTQEADQCRTEGLMTICSAIVSFTIMGWGYAKSNGLNAEIQKMNEKIENTQVFRRGMTTKNPAESIEVTMAEHIEPVQETDLARSIRQKEDSAFHQNIDETTIEQLKTDGNWEEHCDFSKEVEKKLEYYRDELISSRDNFNSRCANISQTWISLARGATDDAKSKFYDGIGLGKANSSLYDYFRGVAQNIQQNNTTQSDEFQKGIPQALQLIEQSTREASRV